MMGTLWMDVDVRQQQYPASRQQEATHQLYRHQQLAAEPATPSPHTHTCTVIIQPPNTIKASSS